MNSTGKPAPPSSPRASRLTLIQKLIASYAAMAFFTLAALVFSILGLYSLNKTAREIAQNDLTIISSLTRLRASLLAQEGYAGKYAILRSDDFINLFHQREKETLDILDVLASTSSAPEFAPLGNIYKEYHKASARLFAGSTRDTSAMGTSAKRMFDTVDALYAGRQHRLQAKLEAANNEERSTAKTTLTLAFTGFFLAITVAAVFVYRFSFAFRKLQRATHRIAEGDFDFDPQIPAGDEIGNLASDFTSMAARLKVLEQMSLDASPLTRLPGNIAIERVLDKRLHSGIQFAVCYADLDNFKAFNDRYGYIKGSELIKTTGEIIYEAVKTCADDDAFVGHVGGDDFVMVISTETINAVCEAVIGKFSAEVPRFYNDQDIATGGIEGVDRYGVSRFFPIITISIAVVICSREEFAAAVDIAKSAAEIKDYVKERPGSCYFISRRKHKR